MNVFFDLDGTLVDASDRLYQLFQILVSDSEFSKEEYWQIKRKGISHKEILRNNFAYRDSQILEFEQTWLGMIELPNWIALDKPFHHVTNYLSELEKRHTLFVVTARQLEEQANVQIQQYGWSDFFEDILVTKQQQEKSELIKTMNINKGIDWLIGDTGKDIEAGKEVGLQTAAVLSGFLNKEKLMGYKPDLIVKNVVELTFKDE